MIRMTGGAGGNHTNEIPGNHCIGICSANPFSGTLSDRTDPARPHCAITATCPKPAEFTLGALRIKPLPGRVISFFFGQFQHFLRSLVYRQFLWLFFHILNPPESSHTPLEVHIDGEKTLPSQNRASSVPRPIPLSVQSFLSIHQSVTGTNCQAQTS